MDHEIHTEYNPWHTQIDPSPRTQRVCELEEKQWFIGQHVSEISCASQWWKPRDDDYPNSGGCKRVPVDLEIVKEKAPLRAHRDPPTGKTPL